MKIHLKQKGEREAYGANLSHDQVIHRQGMSWKWSFGGLGEGIFDSWLVHSHKTKGDQRYSTNYSSKSRPVLTESMVAFRISTTKKMQNDNQKNGL